LDLKDVGFGALVGAAGWELLKHLFSGAMKRHADAKESSRKLLRDDIEKLVALVCEVIEQTSVYYAASFESEVARQSSRLIRGKCKVIGAKLESLNATLNGQGVVAVNSTLWFRFKAATTQHLDVSRPGTWSDDDPRISEIYEAANFFHIELNRLRHDTV